MKPVTKIVLVWLAWALILIGYQSFVQMRFQPVRPDRSLSWTPDSTQANSNQGKIYLNDPFMNSQVAWDSEYYLSIATVGYDDPAVQGIPPNFNWGTNPRFCVPGAPPACYSRNYAFFPFYPYLSRVVAFPLRALPLTPIAASTLGSVLVSLLGTLGAALALYELAKDELEEEGALRAVFYLLIFPSAFFLAQVYTEGLFVGLAFGSLAFMKRRQWVLAGLLAGLATWTRAAGGLLLVPLAITWLSDLFGFGVPVERGFSRLDVARANLNWRSLVGLVFVALPGVAYLIWNNTLGIPFRVVEDHYFSRGVLLIPQSIQAWSDAFTAFMGDNLQARAYYTVEFAAIIIAVLACALTFKRYPWIALFGFLVIFFSFFSGAAMGMHRYVLAVPSIYILLARWGKNEAFNRSWTVASILTMGLMAAMFSFDFWAG